MVSLGFPLSFVGFSNNCFLNCLRKGACLNSFPPLARNQARERTLRKSRTDLYPVCRHVTVTGPPVILTNVLCARCGSVIIWAQGHEASVHLARSVLHAHACPLTNCVRCERAAMAGESTTAAASHALNGRRGQHATMRLDNFLRTTDMGYQHGETLPFQRGF